MRYCSYLIHTHLSNQAPQEEVLFGCRLLLQAELVDSINHAELDVNDLEAIPLVLAGWIRYLMGVDDFGNTFQVSPDSAYNDVYPFISHIKLGDEVSLKDLEQLITNEKIFCLNLIEAGLGPKIVKNFNELNKEKGAIKKTLEKLFG